MDKYKKEFLKIRESSRQIFKDIAEETLNKRIDSKRWPAAEYIQHLNIITGKYFPFIHDAIEKHRINQISSNTDYRSRFLMNQIINLIEPPYKFKMKAPFILFQKKGSLKMPPLSYF